jgi:hypothetical protein
MALPLYLCKQNLFISQLFSNATNQTNKTGDGWERSVGINLVAVKFTRTQYNCSQHFPKNQELC